MHICSLDPVSMKEVITLKDAPYVVEGSGQNYLVIYFESETNRNTYLEDSWEWPDSELAEPYGRKLDSSFNGKNNQFYEQLNPSESKGQVDEKQT